MQLNPNSWLLNTPIAHRGLWNNSVIENSVSAYQNAVNNGFPIEIDLYSSTDGVLYSFHDKTLSRMTGQDGFIFDKSSSQLDSYRLIKSNERIPKFSEVLSIANGKVPLLIEIKNQPKKDIVNLVLKELENYKGEFAIQSFNPLYILKIKKLAPNIIRGILATNVKEELKGEKPFTRFIVKNMALNFLIKPNFISFDYRGLPLKKRKTKKIPVISWTVTDSTIQKNIKPFAKNIIFENFIPDKE